MHDNMKRKKSPLLLRKSAGGDGSRTPKQGTPPASSSSLLAVPTTGGAAFSGTLATGTPSSVAVPTDEYFSSDELVEWDGVGLSLISNGSQGDNIPISVKDNTGLLIDDLDICTSASCDTQRTRAAIDNLCMKIDRTKELIKSEQNSRDENVNEYLKLASNADKQQVQRIKNVFEKKNQKSAQTISQLQKKLDNYGKRIRDLETHGLSVASHWQPREVLRDVGQGLKDVGANIKEGITGFSGSVMSKPREFAHLIKNRFGSADNISSVGKEATSEEGERNLHGSATFSHRYTFTKYMSDDESGSSLTSGSRELTGGVSQPAVGASPHHQHSGNTAGGGGSTAATGGTQQAGATVPASGGNQSQNSEGSSMATAMPPPGSHPYHTGEGIWPDVEHLILEISDEVHRISDELESIKTQMQQEYSYFNQSLQEERYRYEHLEEQMNDLIELHQNEIENLKQGITDMEEKVQYQSEERLRDVQEVLESCQTRVSRMEHQQHQHLQQLVTLDTLDNSHARALVLKLINVLLMVLQLLLLLVATLANIAMPFLQSRVRILSTSILIASLVLICRQWPHVLQIGSQTLGNYFPDIMKSGAARQ